MEIHSISVREYHVHGFRSFHEGHFVRKSLPFLSVVQSPKGSYGIRLDEGEWAQTGPMGAFIAPAGKMQEITHHVDPVSGEMHAQWIFLDVILNDTVHLDSAYDFPLLLPEAYQPMLYEMLQKLRARTESTLPSGLRCCDDLADILPLIRVLLEIGTPRSASDPMKNRILSHIRLHYSERISSVELADLLGISVPGVFRKFHTFFGQTPSEFINDFRLSQASVLLETGNLSIGEVARNVGFEDAFYFSRLFKAKYGISPSGYRKRNGS